ncbi:MAG: hypothetical protein ACLFWL_10635 [Candidatus Brocadiia bacterium]|nr:hypothetical protein [Planctomycetota bacterium]
MKNSWAARIICLMGVLAILFVCGCNAFSAQRQRRRRYVIETDLDHIVDDVDWVLGLHEPSGTFDETMR